MNCRTKLALLVTVAVVATGLPGCKRLETYTPSEVSEEQAGDEFRPPEYWAMKWVSTTVVDVPVLSQFDFLATQTTDYYVVKWIQQGDEVIQDEIKCALDISEVVGMKASMPDEFFECCGARLRMAEVDEFVVGGRYTSNMLTVYGARLEDREYEDLPSSADDPRVEDTDGDGNPGITSLIDGWIGDGHAEVYITQRARSWLEGTIVREDRIEGYLEQDVEQYILGASEGDDWAAADGYSVVPDGVPEHNFFILQALDGAMTCDEMNALDDIDALFEMGED